MVDEVLNSYLCLPGWPGFKQEHFISLLEPFLTIHDGSSLLSSEGRKQLRESIDIFAADDKCPIRAVCIAKRLSMRLQLKGRMYPWYSSDPKAILEDLGQLNALIQKGDPDAVSLRRSLFGATLSFEPTYMLPEEHPFRLEPLPTVLTFEPLIHDEEAFHVAQKAGGLVNPPEDGEGPPQDEALSPAPQQNHTDRAAERVQDRSNQNGVAIIEDEDFESAILKFWREKELERIRRLEATVATRIAAFSQFQRRRDLRRPTQQQQAAAEGASALPPVGAAAAAAWIAYVEATYPGGGAAAVDVEAPGEHKEPQ